MRFALFLYMKYFVCLFILLPNVVYAQKQDYIWVSGDSNDSSTTEHGGIIIDFNQMPVKSYYKYRKINMFVCNASICDTAGNLLFYTNGCDIAGPDDEILQNGDTINPGWPHQLHCFDYNDGYASGIQSALALALPMNDTSYYLFHKSYIIKNNPIDVVTNKLLYSTINASHNTTSVVNKNVELINDELAFGELIAVKQANGLDWWVITPKRNSSTFYLFNFTKNGIVDTFQQTIGIQPAPQGEGYGQIVFSPDGSKLYRTNPRNPIMVYSFDREAGAFTQFDTIHYEYGNQPVIGEIGCAVSPNGRFLYLACRRILYQLDLWAPDISSTQTVVAEWDGFADPFPTHFWQCQLGPDCKIYIRAGGDTRYFHVIHNPDEPGLACNVEQRGLPLPTPSGASMPSFPNYRLGPLDNPGLPCSPIVSVSDPVAARPTVLVYPNPASEQATFVWPEAAIGENHLLLFNSLGQPVRDLRLGGSEGTYTLRVADLQAGVYFWAVSGEDGSRLGAGKIVKQ